MKPPNRFPSGRSEVSVYLLNPDTSWPLSYNNLQLLRFNGIQLESFIISFFQPIGSVANILTHTHTRRKSSSKMSK